MSLSRLLSITLGIFLLAGGFFVFADNSQAAFLKQIHYQGRLYNSAGVLQGGAGTQFCFKFSIYEDATVGAPDTKLWPTGSPTGQSLNVQYGVFNYDLGSDATDGDLGSIDWQTKGDTSYLQIEAATKVGPDCTDTGGVESWETLSPRQRVVSQANALNADKLQNASPGTGNSNILKLNASGGIDLTGTTAGLSAAGSAALTLNASSTGNIQFFGSSYTLSNTGALTIGSITGTGALTIAAGGSNTALVLNANGTGKVQLAAGSTGDIEFFNTNNKISSSGNLTITGGITAATSSTINGVSINSGAVSGVTTLGLSGAITGATSTNTINGLIINAGALSGITTISASGQITSTLATGTAPFSVASTTNVANLNASSLNGATFAAPGAIGGTTPGAGTFTTLIAQTSITSGGTGTSALLQAPINDTVGSEKAFILNHTGTAFGQNADLLLELQEGGAAKFSINRNGLITTASVDNSSVVSSAAISYSKLNLATSIVGGDLATNITISTTGNIATTGTGAITSAGLLTGSNGLTISSGSVSLPSASIADSALSTNVALKNAANTFTADQTIATSTATDDTIILDPFTGGAARFAGSITTADLTATRTYTLPDASGTLAVAGSSAIGLSSAGAVSLTLSGNTADSGTTSNSGLVIVSTGVSLLRGCNNGEILKWASPSWACSSDSTGAGSFITKNAQDTSSASVAGILYDFTNSNTGASAQVLRLTNAGTSNALEVVQSSNPAAGKALIYANNSNVSPSGNLIDLRAGGNSKFSVDAAGAVTIASGQSYLGAGALTVSSGGTGSLTLKTANQSAPTTNSSNLSLSSGDASGTTSDSGNVIIDVGAATGNTGSILIGSTNGLTKFGSATVIVGAGANLITGTIDTTSTGNFLRFVNEATEKFRVDASGTVTIAGGQSLTSGGALAVTAGAGSALTLTGNAASSFNTTVGNITLDAAGGTVSLGGSTVLSSNAGLTLQSGGTGNLTLNPASGILFLSAGTGSLRRTAAGVLNVNLYDASATTLTITNTNTGVADLNIDEGSLQLAGIARISNAGAATLISGAFTNSSNQLSFGTGSGTTGTVSFNVTGGDKTITIPNETGTLCTNTTVCSNYAPSTGGNYLARNTSDTSSASFAGNLYSLTNTNTGAAGVLVITNSGSNPTLDIAHTSITSNSDIPQLRIGAFTQTLTANITDARFNQIFAPTIAGDSGTRIVTNAGTLFIERPPITGANASITNEASILFGNAANQAVIIKQSADDSVGRSLSLISGRAGTATALNSAYAGGGLSITAGAATQTGTGSANGGPITLTAGNGAGTAGVGGNVVLVPGSGTSSNGQVQFFSSSNNITSTGNLTLAGTITAATSGTINGLSINSGALTGVTTISASGQITSTLATGTAPFSVASTTNVANLNASSLNGATFAAPGAIGGTTPGAGTFTTLAAQTSFTLGLSGTAGSLSIPFANTAGTDIGLVVNHTGTAFAQVGDLLLDIQEGGISKFSASKDGDIVAAGTINTNTFSPTALTFSGASPNISASTANTPLTINSNGTGTITLASSSTGNVGFYNVSNNFITSSGALTIAGAATINGTGTSSIAGLTTLGSAALVSSTNLLQGTVDSTSTGNFLRFVNEATEKFKVSVNGNTSITGQQLSVVPGSGISESEIGFALSVTESGIFSASTNGGAAARISVNDSTSLGGGFIGLGIFDMSGTGTGTGNKRLLDLSVGSTASTFGSSADVLFSSVNRANSDGYNLLRFQSGSTLTDVVRINAYGSLTLGNSTAVSSGDFISGTVDTTSTGNFLRFVNEATEKFKVDVNGALTAASSLTTGVLSSTNGSLVFNSSNAGSFTTTINASASQAASYTLTLPVNQASGTQFLQNNGSGVLSWASSGGGCSTCLQQVPTADSDNTVVPTADVTSLTLRQTSNGTPTKNIFAITNSGNTSNYAQLSSAASWTLNSAASQAFSLQQGTSNFVTISSAGALTASALGTNQTLTLASSGSGAVNISNGDLQTGGTTRLSNAGVLNNITGLTQTSGTVSITSNATSGNSLSLTNTTLNSSGSTLAGFSFTENLSATGTVNGLTLTPTLSGTAAANTYTTNVLNVANVAGSCPGTATCVNNGLSLGTGLTNYITSANFVLTSGGTVTQGGNLVFSGATPTISASTTNTTLAISANGSGTVTLGSTSTGDIQFYSASNKITNAGALTIAAGATLGAAPTLTNASGTLTISSAGALAISSGGTNTDVTVNAIGTGNIIVGGTVLGGIVRIGDATNKVEFAATSRKLSFSGTARQSRKVVLTPEFQGAVLTGDGANNTGTMTSDFCSNGNTNPPNINTTICNTSGDLHNYYSWTSTGANDYDVWVYWQVPSDFDEFDGTTAIKFVSKKSAAGDAVTLTVYTDADTICGSATALGTTAAWTTTNYADPTACDVVSGGTIGPGDLIPLRIQLAVAANANTVQIGALEINYLSKF